MEWLEGFRIMLILSALAFLGLAILITAIGESGPDPAVLEESEKPEPDPVPEPEPGSGLRPLPARPHPARRPKRPLTYRYWI